MPVYRHTNGLLKTRYTAARDRANTSIILLLEAIIEANASVAPNPTANVRADEPGVEADRRGAN